MSQDEDEGRTIVPNPPRRGVPAPPVEARMDPVVPAQQRLGQAMQRAGEKVDHPSHYGGEENPYETIKVIEAWGLNFNLGTAVKYIPRAGKKPGEDYLTDLRKAVWYIQREIANEEKRRGRRAE